MRSSGSRPSSEINQVVCVRILLGIFLLEQPPVGHAQMGFRNADKKVLLFAQAIYRHHQDDEGLGLN